MGAFKIISILFGVVGWVLYLWACIKWDKQEKIAKKLLYKNQRLHLEIDKLKSEKRR